MRIYWEKIRVSGGQSGIARAVLAWSPTVADKIPVYSDPAYHRFDNQKLLF
jgi:hypothetical protein